MLKCKDIAHHASELVDNRLRWYQKLPWYLHLMLCSNCRRFVHQLRLTVTTMQRLARRRPRDEDIKQVMDSIKKTQGSTDDH